MCGIYFACSRNRVLDPSNALKTHLVNRGPDCCKLLGRTIEGSTLSNGLPQITEQPHVYLNFLSTVLSLRSEFVVEQPLIDLDSGSILCWNGEAWKINGIAVTGNDAPAVLDLLVQSTHLEDGRSVSQEARRRSNQRIVDAFSRIEGPYAFIFYDARNFQIVYGRDVLGRRSLLVNRHPKSSFVISSICDPENPDAWKEVEPNRIHTLDLRAAPHAGDFHLTSEEERLGETPNLPDNTYLNRQLPPINKSEPIIPPTALTFSSPTVQNLCTRLEASLQLRVGNIPLPPCGQAKWPRLAILFSGGLDCTLLARLLHDIMPFDQEIDLLNVAFENPRIAGLTANARAESLDNHQTPYALCPDRITGISSHSELRKVCPERKWRLICIDIPYSELMKHQPGIITLIKPHNTEMDLSIASALYFAARGKGMILNHAENTTDNYTTPAQVLLSGLGADELFAGYQRHATAFYRRGYSALIKELELDVNRIGQRNLGRDDRVICTWGKEVRYPYLDEELFSWALSLPIWEKCGFGAQPNIGDRLAEELEPGKRLLRLLAQKLGLYGVATEKKRAIQFGARTARMEIGRVKGTQALS